MTDDRFRAELLRATSWRAAGEPELLSVLEARAAVVVRGAADPVDAERMAARVAEAREVLIRDFGGEQLALGRAFYTHLETGRTKEYFARARESDAFVESILPGIQERTLGLLARIVGGAVRRRPGFCGPGVHLFPARENVACRGGVVHFDLEGLTDHQKRGGDRAVTLVWMLRPGAWGGGLRLWDVRYEGIEDSEIEPDDYDQVTVRTEAGDVLILDSRRLHQIRPFRGDLDRISITVHGVEVDRGVWEAWF